MFAAVAVSCAGTNRRGDPCGRKIRSGRICGQCRGEIARGLNADPTASRTLSAAYATLPDVDDGAPTAGVVATGDPVEDLLAAINTRPSPERTDAIAGIVARLTPEQRHTLVQTEPFLVGNTDGFPLADRYEANQLSIAGQILTERNARRRAVLQFLSERKVLLFDPARRGRVATVSGDLEHATHLAVWVPGMNANLANFDEHIFVKSDSLHQEIVRLAGNDMTPATITWLGYDAPPTPFPRRFQRNLSILSTKRARRGGERLRNLFHWVDHHHTTTPSTTAVGFSYGSTTVSSGLKQGMKVDHAVLIGSPGMVVDHVDEYPEASTKVFSITTESDFVGWLAWYGADPADASSGAVRLAHGPASVGHTKYHEDSEAMMAAALVTLGHEHHARRYQEGREVALRHRVGRRVVRSLTSVLRRVVPR